jgi:hypothetical protein
MQPAKILAVKHRSCRRSPDQDEGNAFLPDIVRRGGGLAPHRSVRTSDDDAEASAEEFLMTATSAEDAFEDARDEVAEEEDGGPFLVSLEETIEDERTAVKRH